MSIAFFDSGVGGLSVMLSAQELMKNTKFIYYADSKNAPYGTKSKEEILELVDRATTFLSHLNLDALVLACNTATSVAVNMLRAQYTFPVIGMEPAVKPALALDNSKQILICATDLTLREDKLNQLITQLDANKKTQYLSLQELVLWAENQIFDSNQVDTYLKEKFSNIDWSEISSIVLGCTHFLYYKNAIKKLIPSFVQIVDGNLGTVRNLIQRLSSHITSSNSETSFYVSGASVSPQYFDPYFKILKSQS